MSGDQQDVSRLVKLLCLFRENNPSRLKNLGISDYALRILPRLRVSGYLSKVNKKMWVAESPLLRVLEEDDSKIEEFVRYALRPNDVPKPFAELPNVVGNMQYRNLQYTGTDLPQLSNKKKIGFAQASRLTGLTRVQLYSLRADGTLSTDIDRYGNPVFFEEELRGVAVPIQEPATLTSSDAIEDTEEQSPLEAIVDLLLSLSKRQEQMFERVESMYQMIVAVAGPATPTPAATDVTEPK